MEVASGQSQRGATSSRPFGPGRRAVRLDRVPVERDRPGRFVWRTRHRRVVLGLVSNPAMDGTRGRAFFRQGRASLGDSLASASLYGTAASQRGPPRRSEALRTRGTTSVQGMPPRDPLGLRPPGTLPPGNAAPAPVPAMLLENAAPAQPPAVLPQGARRQRRPRQCSPGERGASAAPTMLPGERGASAAPDNAASGNAAPAPAPGNAAPGNAVPAPAPVMLPPERGASAGSYSLPLPPAVSGRCRRRPWPLPHAPLPARAPRCAGRDSGDR